MFERGEVSSGGLRRGQKGICRRVMEREGGARQRRVSGVAYLCICLAFPWVSLRFPLGSCTKCAQSVEDGKGKDGCQV